MARKTDKKTIDPQPRAGIFRVFQANETILKRFLKRITPSSLDVDDITQETILRALQAEKMRDIQEPKAYIFSIAKNVVRDELDKKSRSIVDFIEDFRGPTDISEEPLADEQVDTRQRMLLFWEAVATLPAQCQRVFVLKKVYGYSHQEISRQLGISISTIEKHAAAGLKRSSEYMDRHLRNTAAKQPSRMSKSTDKAG